MKFSSRRFRSCVCSLVLACLVSLPGCSKEPRGGPRVDTYPIKGQVMVDGKPANYLQVVCHATNGDPAVPFSISAFTDPEGRFTISTYEGGDGAPAGEYRLTFMWGQINLFSGLYGGPDKLNGKYVDPETSEVTVTVGEGTEDTVVDLGVIELTTDGGEVPTDGGEVPTDGGEPAS